MVKLPAGTGALAYRMNEVVLKSSGCGLLFRHARQVRSVSNNFPGRMELRGKYQSAR